MGAKRELAAKQWKLQCTSVEKGGDLLWANQEARKNTKSPSVSPGAKQVASSSQSVGSGPYGSSESGGINPCNNIQNGGSSPLRLSHAARYRDGLGDDVALVFAAAEVVDP